MRVLHITPTFAPQIGGIEKVVGLLADGLAQRGVCSGVAHVATSVRRGREQHGDVDVWRVPLVGHRLAGLAPGLGAAVRAYDLLHVHDPHLMALTFSALLCRAGRPMVLSTHGGYRHTTQLSLFKAVHEQIALRRMLSLYNRILATSRSDYEYFSRFTQNVVLAENGVEISRFAKIRDRGRSVLRWISWGRFSRNKRLDASIELARVAVNAGHAIDYLIAGPDPDGLAAGLQDQINGAGLSQAVKLAPPLSDAELDRELSTRGVYITASEHEGFGLSVVEAMAAGLIVGCRDMAPLNGFITSGQSGCFFGFHSRPSDEARLRRLLSLDDKHRHRISRAARAVSEQYGWESATTRFQQIYADVIAKAGAKAAPP